MNLNRINYGMIAMDLAILSSPFVSAELFGPDNSWLFLGFALTWIFLSITKGKVNKKRYLLD